MPKIIAVLDAKSSTGSRPWEKKGEGGGGGGGGGTQNKIVRPFRTLFALKIRGAAPLGPSPESATEKDKNGRETQITE